ncbi:hypothetical protein HK096_008507 [Nowakowskiella sp. JEL0078]|nr:hypothetical protein HK096_008507 [Nowakowskiella sp. JEL0078]
MSDNEKYELYSRGFCPFTQMVRVAFNFKEIPYTFTRWSPSDPEPEWLAQASPDNTVPVLRLLDGSFTNSSVKMIALAEEKGSGPTLYPNEFAAEWEATLRTELVPSFLKVLMAANPKIQAEFRPKLTSILKKITDHLEKSNGKYFFGDSYSVIDVICSPLLHRLPLIQYFRGPNFSNPVLATYISSLETHPAFQSIQWPLASIRSALIMMLPKMRPMSAGRLQHIAIRAHFAKVIELNKALVATESKEEAIDLSRELTRRVETLVLFIEQHAAFEEQVVYPVFEEMSPGSTTTAHDEHVHDEQVLASAKRDFPAAQREVENAEDKVIKAKEAFGKLLPGLEKWNKAMTEHMAGEEKDLFPMTEKLGEREIGVFRKIYYHCVSVREVLLPFVMEFLSPQERMQYMNNISEAVFESDFEQWQLCGKYLAKSLPKAELADLVERLPKLAKAL